MLFKLVAGVLLAATAMVAHAQTQSQIKVDGKDYTVTEFAGRTSHLAQLAGPEGTAMVSVDNSGKITAILSPPGGGGQQDLITKVWAAYQNQKNSGNAANANATPAAGNSKFQIQCSDRGTPSTNCRSRRPGFSTRQPGDDIRCPDCQRIPHWRWGYRHKRKPDDNTDR